MRRMMWRIEECKEPEQDLVQFAENNGGEWYQDAQGRIYCHSWGSAFDDSEPRKWSMCNPPAMFDEDGHVIVEKT